MKKTIIIFALIFTATPFAFSKILMNPYLQAIDSRDFSIAILTETDSPNSVIVAYSFGNKIKYDTSNSYKLTTEKTYIHRNYLRNLTPAVEYKYWIIDDGKKIFESNFKSPVGNNEPFTFGIFGDMRSGIKKHNQIAGLLAERNPHFSVYLGDLCYRHDYSYWKDEFFIENELNLISKVPFSNAVGNHEDWKPNTEAFLEGVPKESNHHAYYDYYYGDIHFIVISTEHRFSKGSEQYNFLKNVLENSNGKFKVVSMHIPAYGGGGHGENKKLIELTKDLFVPNKVDLVLTGHIHNYQRSFIDGIHHLIVAGGGAPLYTPEGKDYTIVQHKKYNYGIGEYNQGKLTITIYDDLNNILDKFEIKK